MANFDTSNLVTAQTIIDDKYSQPEMRLRPYPVTRLMVGNTPFMVANLNEIKTRDDRTFEVHLLSRTKRSTGSSRTHNHTGTIDDSQKVTPTFATYSDVTSISLKLLDKSVFDFNTVLANKLAQCMMNILEDIEVDNVAWLLTNKTQYSQTLNGQVSFNTTNDFVEIAATSDNKTRIYQLAKSALYQNFYSGEYDFVADNQLAVEAAYLAAQGSGNSANTAFQFMGINLAESNTLADANYTNGVLVGMPAKSICSLAWIPQQNRMGWGDYNSYVGGFGVMSDPWGLGLQFAVHGYASRTDTSASNGDTQDVTIEFEVSLDISNNKAPLSGGNNETVIFAMGLTA